MKNQSLMATKSLSTQTPTLLARFKKTQADPHARKMVLTIGLFAAAMLNYFEPGLVSQVAALSVSVAWIWEV